MSNFSFGSNPTTATGPSFSFGSNTGQLGSFGAAASPAPPGSSLAFRAPAPVPGGLALNLKSTPAMTATVASTVGSGGFTFGGPPQLQATAPPTTGLSFFNTPTSATATPTLNFGVGIQPTTTAVAGSGVSTATPPPQGGGMGSSLFPAAAASATSTNKATVSPFGVTPNTSSAALNLKNTNTTGLTFGSPATAKTTATGFTLPVASTTSTGIFGSLNAAPTTAATATSFKGLGGVDASQALSSLGSATTAGCGLRPDSKSAKENQVPNDILQSIEDFKGFVKNQKNLSCEVARASVKPMAKVNENTQALQQLLFSLSTDVQRNNFLVERLKADTSKSFAQCEMAQRTHDTPAGLQNDNTAPLEFFICLASRFEHSVQLLRQEINNTEKHVNTLSQPSALAPQDLSLALKRLHESFVALAGRLQVVHQTVVLLKERHLSLRRHFLKDSTDIFAKAFTDLTKKNGSFAGPTPFSALGTMQTLGMMATQDKMISSFPGGSCSVPGWGTTQTCTPMPSLPTGSNLFSNASYASPSTADSCNFQLLKPPPGNKRGKR